jgi:uncharacterized RDD family membrane protein YckC
MFLYLAEGMIVAAGAIILLFYFIYPFLIAPLADADGNLVVVIISIPIIIFLFGRFLLSVAELSGVSIGHWSIKIGVSHGGGRE